MSEFVMLIRKQHGQAEEILGETRSETIATNRVDRAYNDFLADAVAVVEVDSGFMNTVYKRERKCKHPNVQFTLTDTGVHPVCEQCGLVMVVNEITH